MKKQQFIDKWIYLAFDDLKNEITTDLDAVINNEMTVEEVELTREMLIELHKETVETTNENVLIIERFRLIWRDDYWYVMCSHSNAYMTKISYLHQWKSFWWVMQGESIDF